MSKVPPSEQGPIVRCARCGVGVEAARAVFDGAGRKVCEACSARGDVIESQERALDDFYGSRDGVALGRMLFSALPVLFVLFLLALFRSR